MLKLFSRFSRNQKLVMGFFVFFAIVGTALAFFVHHTILLIGLFWLIAVLAFVTIMLIRRLNAKISRMSRRGPSMQVKKKVIKSPSRLNSAQSLTELKRQYGTDKSAARALPLARKMVQETGSISKAHKILSNIAPDTALHADE